MGTSTARRGPGTPLWRLAKGAATRYMAPEGASDVSAREVVRRYVAALQENSAVQGQDLLAGFRLTRKVAQRLGEFGDALSASGLAPALKASGVKKSDQLLPEEVIPGLAQAWIEEPGGLEAAVAGSALAMCLSIVLTSNPSPAFPVDGPSLCKTFLALALSQRLALDLGESLEAAAAGWPAYHRGLAGLQAELMAGTPEMPGDPPGAGQWQGLAGWLFVTGILENLLQRFQGDRPAE
jgi:hypothetical protein